MHLPLQMSQVPTWMVLASTGMPDSRFLCRGVLWPGRA